MPLNSVDSAVRNAIIASPDDIIVPQTSVFAEHILGYVPYEYNIPYLDTDNRFIMYRSGRKVGKSRNTAAKILHYAWFAPYLDYVQDKTVTIVICAPTENQAVKILMRDIRSLASTGKYISSYVRKDGAKELAIDWINGKGTSFIHSVPAGSDGTSVRGFNPYVIVVDEASWMRDSVLTALIPAGSATNARIWMTTTPFGQAGFVYNTCMGARMLNKPIDDVHSDLTNTQWVQCNASSLDNPTLTQEYLAELKKFPDAQYKQEVLGVFVGSGFALIPKPFLVRAIRPYKIPQGARYALGIDPASGGNDEAVFIVIAYANDNAYLISTEAKSSTTQTEIADIAQHYKVQYGVKMDKIFIDNTSWGRGSYEQLVERGISCTGITFTNKAKNEVYYNLQRAFQDDRIWFGDQNIEDKLLSQLTYMQQLTTNDRNVKMHSDTHDDYADAFALAIQAINTQSGWSLMRDEDNKPFSLDNVWSSGRTYNKRLMPMRRPNMYVESF